jgi:hypothetical protein
LPLDDIDPDILEFVDGYVDRFVTWDVLAFFHENPGAEKKPSSIASEIGRKAALVEAALESLKEKGVLAREPDEADEPTYRYAAPPGFSEDLAAFLAATRDRTTRLAIVSRVLQKEARRL